MNCVTICQYGAYSKTNDTKQDTEKQIKRIFNNFLINNLLLVSGLVMIFSGLALQLGFHMGRPSEHPNGIHGIQSQLTQYEQLREIDTSKLVCGFNYPAWSAIHKFIIVFFSLFIIFHTYVHWKWYKNIITKHFIVKNKQVINLSILFLLVAITGIIPWFIDLSGGSSIIRKLFIEIHDKLTFVLTVFLVLHFVKKAKWFATAYAKIKR